MKKLIVSMITLVGLITFSAPYGKVSADQATSNVGIRFVEGNNRSTYPNEENRLQPGSEIGIQKTEGKTKLPKTGGGTSVLYYVIGIVLIGLASLLVMKSNTKNIEERVDKYE